VEHLDNPAYLIWVTAGWANLEAKWTIEDFPPQIADF
jgi:hypothetical protein